jgi:Nitroreductase
MQSVIKYSVILCCVFLLACQGKSSVSQSESASSGGNSSVSLSSSSESTIDASVDDENAILQAILNRKSVREYSDKEISQDIIDNLLKAGMSAPSSRDRRPWHFIVISDKAVLENLGDQLKNASCLKSANKAIIVCGDDELSDNCWFLDCSAAAQNILIAAEAMGLGAVWTAVYPYDDRAEIVNKVFKLQKNIHALTIIPLGYPLEKGEPKNKFDASRVHYDEW